MRGWQAQVWLFKPWEEGATNEFLPDEWPAKSSILRDIRIVYFVDGIFLLAHPSLIHDPHFFSICQEMLVQTAPQISTIFVSYRTSQGVATALFLRRDVRNCYAVGKEGGCSKRRCSLRYLRWNTKMQKMLGCCSPSGNLVRQLNIPHEYLHW